MKSIRCQQESWVSAVCVCTGEEGIGWFKQERRGLGWKDFSAAWFLRKEREY